MMRFKLRTLLIGITAICVFLGWIVWMTPEIDGNDYVINRFDLGNDRELVIWGELSWEVAENINYEIREHDRTIVRRGWLVLADSGNRPRLNVMISSDGDAIGCFDRRQPDDLLCVYEFSSGEGWPGGEKWDNSPRRATLVEENRIRERITQKLRSSSRAKGCD